MTLQLLWRIIQCIGAFLYCSYLYASDNDLLLPSINHQYAKFENLDSRMAAEKQLEQLMQQHRLVALGAIISDSKYRNFLYISGNRTVEGDSPVHANDAWHIGSNTKALTALLFARLVDMGLADWETPIADYFPFIA